MPDQKKRVLITTLFLNAFSGSELHAVAIAKSFMECGYDVTIATFHFSYPLLLEIDRNQIHVINAFQENLPYDHYDIFFAQHYVVAEYVVVNNFFTFDNLSVSVLGPLEPLETLPLFAESEADLITFVSEETRDIHVNISSTRVLDKSFVFHNYAEDQWFNAYHEKRDPHLHKIAIVSSHIPPDELEFIKIAESHGLTVDCFGYGNVFTEITPDLLDQYDVIVSIGRTVQASLAQGIPIYCYDHFGGPGYINSLNFTHNKLSNFAGRKANRKISGFDIYREISDGFPEAFKERQLLHNLAKENFQLKIIFDSYLSRLTALPAKRRSLHQFFSEQEKRRCIVTARGLAQRGNYKTGITQIFFDTSSGYNIFESQTYMVILNAIIKLEIDIQVPTKEIRFDPEFSACSCYIKSIKNEKGENLKYHTAQRVLPIDKGEMFIDEDPSISLKYWIQEGYLLNITLVNKMSI